MDRSDGTNLAVGALLVGVAAVILGLLAPTAAAIVGALCGVGGLYLIVGGVYLGWPTPASAAFRAFQPRLEDARAEVRRVNGSSVLLLVRVTNGGRNNLNNASINLVVPDFVDHVVRCTHAGLGPEDVGGNPDHDGTFASEYEKFWDGNITFPGRSPRFVFFLIEMTPPRDFWVRYTVSAPELDEPFSETFNVAFDADPG